MKKIWFLRQEPGWSDQIFARGQIYPGKGPKKSQRAKPKFWGQQVLCGTKFLTFDPKKINLATQTPMYSPVNCTSATSYNYDATITFFVIAQQWTSDLSTINISCSAICTQPCITNWPTWSPNAARWSKKVHTDASTYWSEKSFPLKMRNPQNSRNPTTCFAEALLKSTDLHFQVPGQRHCFLCCCLKAMLEKNVSVAAC